MGFLSSIFSRKKPATITFVNQVPGFAEAYPVIEAKTLKRDWVEKNAEQFHNFRMNTLKSCPIGQFKSTFNSQGFISKCPGIREFMNTGYIITAPCDFIIETYGDGINFNSSDLSPSSNTNLNPIFKISKHSKEQLHDYSPLPLNTLKTVIKIGTGWHVVPDEKYVFLVTTPYYNNETRFTVATGVWDPFIDTQVNPFLFWHVLSGREVVKAGTPIGQYIPIPREFVQPELVCRTTTETDNKRISAVHTTVRSSINNTYKDRRRETVKKIYNNVEF